MVPSQQPCSTLGLGCDPLPGGLQQLEMHYKLTNRDVMQAFAVAAHSSQAHCTLGLNGAQTPLMPDLLADVAPKLPDMDGIPLPDLEVRAASHAMRSNSAQTPLMPDLLADVALKLPDMDGIPLPDLAVAPSTHVMGLKGVWMPLMPDLLADVAPKLPDMDGIPLPDLEVRAASALVISCCPSMHRLDVARKL